MPKPQLRAAIVCVDFADILARTLPWNIHHFQKLLIVTTPYDRKTKDVAIDISRRNGLRVCIYETESFYKDGADFNKWLALEEALDWFGRWGWMCLMDVDILWPRKAPLLDLQVGYLYGPKRYILDRAFDPIPPEDQWDKLPMHRNLAEWPGYTQIFHAEDPHLPEPPWHQTDWRHAGGADSWFQALWPRKHRIRLEWPVLHLGPCGINWCGRTLPDSQNRLPSKSLQRQRRLADYLRQRRGKQGADRYQHERLSNPSSRD